MTIETKNSVYDVEKSTDGTLKLTKMAQKVENPRALFAVGQSVTVNAMHYFATTKTMAFDLPTGNRFVTSEVLRFL